MREKGDVCHNTWYVTQQTFPSSLKCQHVTLGKAACHVHSVETYEEILLRRWMTYSMRWCAPGRRLVT